MKRFIILFTEKEGTSALVRALDNFAGISILRATEDRAWEPFNHDICGSMPHASLRRCLELVFAGQPIDFECLNRIYTRTSHRPLLELETENAVGLKMRFVQPWRATYPRIARSRVTKPIRNLLRTLRFKRFKKMMFELFQQNEVVVFLAVRQDNLRWGLSKYHGGHFQFAIASGKKRKEDLGKIDVNCDRLEEIVRECERMHAEKRLLMEELTLAGIQAYPLLYEDFLSDKRSYFKKVLGYLGLDITEGELDTVLQKGMHFQKVHSECISEFVENHKEVEEKFGNRFISWHELA